MTNPFLTGPAAPPAEQQAPPQQGNPWGQPAPAPQAPPAGNPWGQPQQSPPPAAPPQQGNPWGAPGVQPPQAPPAQSPVVQGAQAAGFSAGPPSAQPAADPFSTPAGAGDGNKIQDDVNQVLLLRPSEFLSQMATSMGPSDAVRVDWIVLTGPNQGAVRQGCFVFNGPLVRELKAVLDGPSKFMVAGLTMGQAKANKSAPYIFVAPQDEHMVLARQAAQAFGWT